MGTIDDLIEEHLSKVLEIEAQVSREMIAGIDLAYQEFLLKHNLPDLPVVQAGYHSVLDQIVRGNPFPAHPVQDVIVTYLGMRQAVAMNEMFDEVDPEFKDAIKRTKT